jgi:hypothetical protein
MKSTGLLILAATLGVGCGGHNSGPTTQVKGEAERAETRVLETGASVQSAAPVKQFDVYLVGFHPMKDNPSIQEAR